MEFTKELKKLGLKDKEAAVYLGCLELGSATAQQISRKAHVVRATTYVELESLMQMGLVTKFKQGKKTLFSAEPPRQLTRLLEKQEESIKEKKEGLNHLLPELQILMKTGGGKPSVRYFEGKEGLHAIRQEIVMHTQPGHTVYNFTPIDYLNAVFPENETVYYKQRSAKGIKAKTIFTTKSPTVRDRVFAELYQQQTEKRFVKPEDFPSTSGMTIYEDRIAIGSFTGDLMGVVIESEQMTDMMVRLFELAWITAFTEKDYRKKVKG
ncbi:MAG: hypothetical protein HYR90_02420 [Candidatus Andersenbacteria bacterium]|nr:hypothetical protein [Candidatus Andersenbacteria bacterium]MBI3251013.1 hypothetical protein [Candidatus Andersenbacteria bacterium]